jgi:hypothetical protein
MSGCGNGRSMVRSISPRRKSGLNCCAESASAMARNIASRRSSSSSLDLSRLRLPRRPRAVASAKVNGVAPYVRIPDRRLLNLDRLLTRLGCGLLDLDACRLLPPLAGIVAMIASWLASKALKSGSGRRYVCRMSAALRMPRFHRWLVPGRRLTCGITPGCGANTRRCSSNISNGRAEGSPNCGAEDDGGP